MKWISKPPLGTQLDWSNHLNKGLSGYWPMNEGMGNKINDLSMNGNTGTLTGMAFPSTAASGWNPGKFGPTLNFDEVNDYVDTNSASLGLNSSDNITIEAWFKTSQTYTDNAMIINDYDRTNVRGWQLSTDDTNQLAVYNIRIVGNYRYIYSTGLINDGIWHHAVAIIMGNGSDIDLYLDGVDQGSSTLVGTGVSQLYFGDGNVIIGRQSTPSERYFNGSIDGVRVYNRALSAAMVLQLYKEPFCIFNR